MTLSLLARSVAVDEALAFLRLPVDGRLPDQLARQQLRLVSAISPLLMTDCYAVSYR
jgi:hypothetical protein